MEASWCSSVRRAIALGVCVISALLAGCGGGERRATYVTHYPQWEYERYDRIAVLPGRAATPKAVRAAGVLADRLTTQLAQNGAFTVLSRAELRDVFAEQDLSRLADAIDEGTALPEEKLKIAQALVATKITDYKLISERQRQTIPQYALDRRGYPLRDRAGRRIVVGEDTVWTFKHGAEVEASARVIDAATGKILLSHTARIAPSPRTSRNEPPSRTPEDMAELAVAELATEFYKAIAPTRLKVKLGGDSLVIATDYYDGRYETVKKLPRSLPEFLLVVRRLPEACERNQFRVAIATDEGRENLFEQEFVWSGSAGPEGISYQVPMETLLKTGSEKFVAKIYSGRDPQPILTRSFSLATEKD
jgi:hypothetical protein